MLKARMGLPGPVRTYGFVNRRARVQVPTPAQKARQKSACQQPRPAAPRSPFPSLPASVAAAIAAATGEVIAGRITMAEAEARVVRACELARTHRRYPAVPARDARVAALSADMAQGRITHRTWLRRTAELARGGR